MGARTIHFVAAVSLLVAGAGAGCVIFTGGTDGYVSADAGATTTVPAVDAGCTLVTEGGVCLVDQCTSAADCRARDDASAAAVCCVGVVGVSPVAIGTTCAVSACSIGTVVSCASSADCDGGACFAQSCPFAGSGASFSACTLFPGCSVVASSVHDAGTD